MTFWQVESFRNSMEKNNLKSLRYSRKKRALKSLRYRIRKRDVKYSKNINALK